jgi:hypothetical protein
MPGLIRELIDGMATGGSQHSSRDGAAGMED